MKITITLKNRITEKQYDIQIDPSQRMITTIQVLREDLPEAIEGIGSDYLLRSERSQRRLDAGLSYKQERIYSGDIIRIENK